MIYNPYKTHTWFSNNFVLKKSTSGWHIFKCPMCAELINRQKMAVHYKYGLVKCWVCQYKKPIIDFMMDILDVNYHKAKDILNECKESALDLQDLESMPTTTVLSEVNLPYGYTSILDGEGLLADRARNYLLGRGYNLEELDRIGIGYSISENVLEPDYDYFGYIIIPFKHYGKLAYYIGRDFLDRGDFKRYKNPPKESLGVGKGDIIFNEDALRLYSEVYITEGWADAIEMGRKGTSTQGWSLSATQKDKYLSSDCSTLILLPDIGKDNTGKSWYIKAVELALDFIEHKTVYVIDLSPMKHLGKDANEIKKENVKILIKEATPLTYEGAINILTE